MKQDHDPGNIIRLELARIILRADQNGDQTQNSFENIILEGSILMQRLLEVQIVDKRYN